MEKSIKRNKSKSPKRAYEKVQCMYQEWDIRGAFAPEIPKPNEKRKRKQKALS